MFENLIVNKYVHSGGWKPLGLSDGGGEVGVSTPHSSTIEKGIRGGEYFIYGKITHKIK